MRDLVVGYFVVGGISLVACLIGVVVVRGASRIVRTFLVAVLVASILAFAVKGQGRLVVAQWLPFSNAILVGNFTMVGSACLAGFVLAWPSLPLWRRTLFSIGMWGVGIAALMHQMPRDPPQSGNEWIDNVCIQSNRASCSACAAATMLAHYGIPADEPEMMELCLTGAKGTPSLGLYRGLKLKTADTPYDVIVFRTDLETLLEADWGPVVLLVKLEVGADVDPRYEQQWGWTPGLGHAVVYYGRAGNDRIEIGDPSIGREQWKIDDLRVLWQGEGIRLRKK